MVGHTAAEDMDDITACWDLMISFEFLTIERLLAAHAVLTWREAPDQAGKLRTTNVLSDDGRKTPPADMVPRLIDSWLMNHSRARLANNIVVANIAFKKVHPFEKGNGRMARIIANWQRVKGGLPVQIAHLDEDGKIETIL